MSEIVKQQQITAICKRVKDYYANKIGYLK
jgi:hypothetical protein